jgi:hypothetical protein
VKRHGFFHVLSDAKKMSALRPSVLAGALIAIATISSCSDSEKGAPVSDAADAATEAGLAGAVGESGAVGAEPTAGGGPTANGGGDAGPGSVGGAGQDSSGGATADPGPEASGGAGLDAGEQLTFCARLTSPTVLAFNMTRAYDHAVYGDCRVTWVTNLYLDAGARETFLNNLLSWSYRFWGCQTPPVDDFALIYQPAPLTSADAAALIDDYMIAAIDQLTLSASESDAMRAALLRLSLQTVAQDSPDFSNSTCNATGGTGGTAGTGGQPASGGAAGASAEAGGSNP